MSVIIPAHNRERFVRRAILSVVDQDCFDISRLEIIVIDDGSTDGTGDDVKGLNVSPAALHYIRIAHTGQPGTVRNVGLARAKGKFIAYCDSDDFWYPHHLATVMNEFRKDESLMMVSTHWGFAIFTPQQDGTILTEYEVRDTPMDNANTNCRVHRRECLKMAGWFNKKEYGEDGDYFLWMERELPCKKIPIITVVNGFIRGGNNITYLHHLPSKRRYQ